LAYKLDLIFGVKTDKSEIKKVESQLDALYKKYNNKKIDLGINTKKSSDGVKNTTANVKKLNTGLKNTATQTKKVNSRMKEAIVSTVQWTLSVGGLYAAINKVKDAFSFTAQIDKSLTEIAMVTGQTREEVSGLKEEYLALGKAIKVSTEELANSAVQLYRQGLSAEEVNDRLGQIAKTAKVAGISVEETMKFVTSGINGMSVSAQEFNDVLLKVASIAATDYQKLGTALQQSAVGFTAAGFSLEQATSIIATIAEVSQQSASSIGSSMKTILARFNKLTAEGKDNTVVLNDIDKALQSIGMTLQDDAGQFRDTSVVLDELGKRWDTLDRNTQNYLGTTIAGVRQQERFRIIMANHNRVLDITKQAYQSAGIAQEQYLKFQESIEGKTNALTNAWERLYGVMVDEGTIGGFLDFAKDLVEGLIAIEDNLGLINTILAITIPLLIAFKGQLMATAGVKIVSFLQTLMITTQGLSGVIGSQIVLLAGWQLALGGIVAIVGLVVAGTVMLAKHQREVDEAIVSSNDALKQYVDTLNEANDIQKEMAEREAYKVLAEETKSFEELRAEVARYTTGLETAKETQEFYAEALKSGEGNQKQLRLQLERATEVVSEYQGKLGLTEKQLQNLTWATGILNGSMEGLNSAVERGIDLQEHWTNKLANMKTSTEDTTVAFERLSEEWHNSIDRIQDMIDQYGNLTGAEKAQAEAMIKSEIKKTEQLKDSTLDRLKLYDLEFDAMRDLMLFGGETLTAEQLKAFKTLKNGVTDAVKQVREFRVTINGWEDQLESLNSTTKETATTTKTVTESFKDLSTQIDSENIKSIERYRDAVVEALDEEKELIDRNKEAWERDFEDRETISDRYYEDLLNSYDSETDALKENRDIQSEIETIQEKQLNLMTLQDDLLNTSKQRNVRILTASGWQWVADPNEIKRINEEISSVEDELESAKQKQVDANQGRAREKTKAHYEKQKLIIERAFEDEKLSVIRGYEDQYNIIDSYLDEIKDLELTNYDQRLLQLNGFINSYNSKMASMGSTSTISGGMQPNFISSGGTPTSKRDETIQQMKLNSKLWATSSPDERKRLADANLSMGSKMGWSRNAGGEWMDETGKRAYANGGLNNYTGDASMHGTATRPEMVLNNGQAAGLFNFIKNMGNMDMGAMMNKTPVSSGGGGDTYNLEIMAPNGATLSGLLTQAKQLAKHGR